MSRHEEMPVLVIKRLGTAHLLSSYTNCHIRLCDIETRYCDKILGTEISILHSPRVIGTKLQNMSALCFIVLCEIPLSFLARRCQNVFYISVTFNEQCCCISGKKKTRVNEV